MAITTVTLYPTSSQSGPNYPTGGGTEPDSYPTAGADITTFHDLVDDWATGPVGSDGVINIDFATSSSYVLFRFDMPVDFVKSLSGSPVQLKVHLTTFNVTGAETDTLSLSTSLVAGGINWSFSGPTTVYTTVGKSSPVDLEVVLDDVASTQIDIADWADHFLRFEWDYTRSKGADDVQLLIKAVELTIQYIDGFVNEIPDAAALTFTGYAPTAFETVLVHKPRPGVLHTGNQTPLVFPGGNRGHTYWRSLNNASGGLVITNVAQDVADVSTPYSVEAWVRDEHLAAEQNTTDFILALRDTSDDVFIFGENNAYHGSSNFYRDGYIPVKIWLRIVYEWDGTTGRFWIDGKLQTSSTVIRTPVDATSFTRLMVGVDETSTPPNEGSYETPLSVAEIRITEGVVRYGDQSQIPIPTDYHHEQGADDVHWDKVSLLVNFREGYVNYGYGDPVFWPISGVPELVPAGLAPIPSFTPGFWLHWVVDSPPALMTFTGQPPTINTGFVSIPTGYLEVGLRTPTLAFPLTSPDALTITGHPPVSYAGPYAVTTPGALTFTGQPPTVSDGTMPIWWYPKVHHGGLYSAINKYYFRVSVPFLWPDSAGMAVQTDRPRVWRTGWLSSGDLDGNCTFYYARPYENDNIGDGYYSGLTAKAVSPTTEWSFSPPTVPSIHMNNVSDDTNNNTGWTGAGSRQTMFAAYHSKGNPAGYPYGAYEGRDCVDSLSDSDFAIHDMILQYDATNDATMVLCGPVPWYSPLGTAGSQEWVGNFYAPDSRAGSEEGYVLGLKVVGSDTVASLYQWSGGTTWDAGTNLTDGTEEAVNYTTDIVGWCCPDTADPDKYYAVVTTKDASTEAFLHFKVFAVVLSTMTITRVINDNVDHGGNGRWDMGYHDGGVGSQTTAFFANTGLIFTSPDADAFHNPGSAQVEERCYPIELGPNATYGANESFYVFRTYNAVGDEAYTRLILNSGNWLAPTYDVKAANLPTNMPALWGDPPDYIYAMRRFISHNVLWDSETVKGEGAYVMILVFRGADPEGQQWWCAVRNLLVDESFTQYRQIFGTTTWPYNTGYGPNALAFMNGGVRGWGQDNGKRIPLAYDLSFMRADVVNYVRGGAYVIHWWLEGNDYVTEVAVQADLGLNNAILRQNPVYKSVDIDLNMGVTIGETQQYGSMFFTGHYELEDTDSLLDAATTISLGLSCDVADDSSITAIVQIDLGLTVDVEHDLITNYRTKGMAINNVYWGQSFVDELIALVNANDRVPNGLPVYRAIDAIDDQRLIHNQTLTDPTQRAALDLRRRDSGQPFQAGDYYANITEFAYAINPKAFLYFSEEIQLSPNQFPTAAQMYSTWNLVDFWDFDWDDYHGQGPGSNDELYIQVGRAWKDSPRYNGVDAIYEDAGYFFISLTNYTDQPYTGIGGGFQPTPHPITRRTLHTSYAVDGVTWLEEFLEIVNAARLDAGVGPLLLPDKEFWEIYPVDAATIHAGYQHDIKLFCHEAPELPEGWRTVNDREQQADWKQMLENNQLFQANPYHDPSNPQAFTYYDIMSNETFITPSDAFTGWWNSPGHKAALLYDWGNKEVYCLMGWRTVQWEEEVLYDDNVHAGSPQIPMVGQTTILVNNFVDVTTIMATKYLNANWIFNGAMIEVLDASYDITTYADVRGEHSAPYSLRITVQHEASYAPRVAAQHKAPVFYGVAADHEAVFASTIPLRTEHDSSYRIKDTSSVSQDHEAPYGWAVRVENVAYYDSPPNVSVGHLAGYDDLAGLRAEHKAEYSAFATVAVAHESPYSVPPPVRASHKADYTTPYGVSASHTGVYALQSLLRTDHVADYTFTSNIRGEHDANYNINTVDTVVTNHTAYYSLLGDAVVEETPVVGITVGSTFIDIDDLVITQGEGDPAWIARARISRQEDYMLLTQQTPAVVTLGAESWNLVVTEQSVSRSDQVSTRMLVKLESPVVNLMSPRASSTTYRYETAMSAKAIVEDILGQSVEWLILDWTVSAGRVAIDDSTPYNAAKLIVAVAGGLIESKLDGTLRVRYEYPVAMNALYGTTPDEVFTDIEDNLSAEEGFEYRSGVNNIRILEGESTFRDRLLWEPEEGDDTRGVLEAYLSPWRTEYTLRHTDSDGATAFVFAGTITREEIELVEFRNGTANVGYPIKELTAVEWQSDPLGGITFNEYSTSLNAGTGVNQGYGLAEVSYVVQLDTYNVTGVLGDAAQFVIEDGE